MPYDTLSHLDSGRIFKYMNYHNFEMVSYDHILSPPISSSNLTTDKFHNPYHIRSVDRDRSSGIERLG
jgi:hypothetical protein